MSLKMKDGPQNKNSRVPAHFEKHVGQHPAGLHKHESTFYTHLEELEELPRRGALFHWFTFTLALLSLGLLATWFFGALGPVPLGWLILEIVIGSFFAVEFFTRSGFRWYRFKYLRDHFFDFVAIVPALAIVQHGFVLENLWVWIVLVARFVRLIDRFLGDGFVTRNALALFEGFEEEITERVLDRIIGRIQDNIDQAGLSHRIAEALLRNKPGILERVKAATPREGVVPSLARIVGLDTALERAEERTFDALVGIVDSEEIDRAVRDAVNSSISSFRKEMGRRNWRQHLGFQISRNKSAGKSGGHANNDAASGGLKAGPA